MSPTDRTNQIAIVGVGGIFPGAPNLDTFWNNIANGVDAGRNVPDGRWFLDPETAFNPDGPRPDRVYSKWGCFIEGFEFDPTGLDLERTLLARLDPLFHLGLHAARAAFRDAGGLQGVDLSRVGVILGNIVLPTESTSALCRDILGHSLLEKLVETVPGSVEQRAEWMSRLRAASSSDSWHPVNRFAASLPAALIATGLGLGGSAYTLDAACASSLYALKYACEELRSFRADAVLAGGMSRPDCQYTQMGFAQLKALSRRGCCAPLSDAADGLVVGEGAGLFVLKRLEDAIRSSDTIYGVIAGIGLSNDRGANLLAPHSEGQLRAMRSAYQEAGWKPSDVDLIECHATGTAVGDAVEIESLHQLWQAENARQGQCVIGGVKSNVGHLLTGAGAAGLMKVLFSLKNQTLPPTANFVKPAVALGRSDSPFRVLRQSEPWNRRRNESNPAGSIPLAKELMPIPRRATINAFGFGGINAHVLIEEFIDAAPASAIPTNFGRSLPDSTFGSSIRTQANSKGRLDVAIVGLAVTSGGCPTLEEFQQRVRSERIDFSPPIPFVTEAIPSIRMPVGEFRIPPLELQDMLPQQQLMLNVAADALRDSTAGRKSDRSSATSNSLGDRTGVFIGIELDSNTTNFHFRWSIEQEVSQWADAIGLTLSSDEMNEWISQLKDAVSPPLSANRVMGNLGGIVASRLAREFNVGGPSFTVSSAENSGLRALELAANALRRGELDQTIVGAVDLPCDIRSLAAALQSRHEVMLRNCPADNLRIEVGLPVNPSESDVRACSDFEARIAPSLHQGHDTARGLQSPVSIIDAATAFVLKRWEDAVRDGDRIYAVITTCDSFGNSHSPIEAVTEIERSFVADFTSDSHPNPRSSVTSSVRNSCEPAMIFPETSGAATGLLNLAAAAVSLSERTLVNPRPHHWVRNRRDGQRQIHVSGLGVDGRQLTFELAESDSQVTNVRLLATSLFAIEGDSTDDLRSGLDQLAARFDSTESISQLAKQWYFDRPLNARHRLAVVLVVNSCLELLSVIDRARSRLNGDADINDLDRQVFSSRDPLGNSGRLAYVFPGSGNAFVGMGRELLMAFPQVMNQQDFENERLQDQFRPDRIWRNDSTSSLLEDHKTMIFSQVAIGTAVCDLLSRFGVRPTASIGYSLGESAALFGLQAWTDRDEMLQRMEDASLFGSDLVQPFNAARQAWKIPIGTDVPWVSGVIDRSASEIRSAIAVRRNRDFQQGETQEQDASQAFSAQWNRNPTRSGRVYLLIVNTPTQCVIGGDRNEIERFVRELGATFIPFPAASTVHCEVLHQVEPAYRALHQMPTAVPFAKDRPIDFYSTAWGHSYPLTSESATEAIVAQAVASIDFPRVIERAYADGVRLFVEIGPGSSCTRMIDEILSNQPHLAHSALPNTASPVRAFLELIATLMTQRVPVDLSELYGPIHDLHGSISITPRTSTRSIVTKIGREPIRIPSPSGGWRFQTRTDTTKRSLQQEVLTEKSVGQACSPNLTRNGHATDTAPSIGLPSNDQPERLVDPLTVRLTNSFEATTTRQGNPYPYSSEVPGINVMTQLEDLLAARVRAHETYLQVSAEAQRIMADQLALLAGFASGKSSPVVVTRHGNDSSGTSIESSGTRSHDIAVSPKLDFDGPPPRSLSRSQCLEFAIGRIGRVLGATFQEIDQHPTRVRLPDEPLMLVDRILEIDGEPLSMTSGRVVTEHDIHANAWYLDGDRIPTCVAVEAGQADLFLSGWLGIDLQTKGVACYRLLDAVVTFHRELPSPGKTIHYDIRINHFFRQGQTYLFRFEFDATVDGQPLLTMREGCAGFFTEAELASGKGIVHTALDRQPRPGKKPVDWQELVPMAVETYCDSQLMALRHGQLDSCFGPAFSQLPVANPMTLPGLLTHVSTQTMKASEGTRFQSNQRSRMWLVDRILKLDPNGGKFGLGTILGELDIHPDDWFLTCHFCDDQVMPGTLMYECCMHTLRIYLLRMGWVGEIGGVVYEPIPGIRSRLKCRGQVRANTKKVWYEITLKEVGYAQPGTPGVPSDKQHTSADVNVLHDVPYCIADALMYADGKPIVEISDMSVRLTGLMREDVERLWKQNSSVKIPAKLPHSVTDQPRYDRRSALFDTDRITAFAIGRPSDAFGDRYRAFDSDRIIARLPGPPFQFLDRIVSIAGCEPWVLKAGGEVVAQYDIPSDAWYFESNRQQRMPFAVLLETALQPCGWLAAYVGSALSSDIDMSFRNLGGTATQYRDVTATSGTLTTTVKMTKVFNSGGMVIQHYDFDLRCNDEPVYVGNTYFGFFSRSSLANQIGIRDAKPYIPSAEGQQRAGRFPYTDAAPFADSRFQMIDDVQLSFHDGPFGHGFIIGTTTVDPTAWFFKAHFHQDPVVPGSLGLESFFQLLKLYAVHRWQLTNEAQFCSPIIQNPGSAAVDRKHEWVYRGQVVPHDKLVTVTAVIKHVDDVKHELIAEGFLSVDGRVIYQMKEFSLTTS